MRYHPTNMLSQLTSRFASRFEDRKLEEIPAVLAATANGALKDVFENKLPQLQETVEESKLLRTVGWVSAGFGAVALGLFVGRELRQRYKFNRRTPYDFYAHSNDEQQDMEFGVGI